MGFFCLFLFFGGGGVGRLGCQTLILAEAREACGSLDVVLGTFVSPG